MVVWSIKTHPFKMPSFVIVQAGALVQTWMSKQLTLANTPSLQLHF